MPGAAPDSLLLTATGLPDGQAIVVPRFEETDIDFSLDGRLDEAAWRDALTVTLDYEMLPRCTYCQPQVASFGITEAQAAERGHQVKVGQFPFRAIGKALGVELETESLNNRKVGDRKFS